ncbi:MAG TPA: nuclear transport factor 2 family protein [Solirubrobacterales bacterium]|nr:nuclear transport factor 2 family protein [Solirubrobacterales bacterium]
MAIPSQTERFFRALYDAFNARDFDAGLASMHPDVNWPNMVEGGREHGHAAVKAYWAKQLETIDPQVEPVRVTPLGEDQVVVDVHQVVSDKDGKVLSDDVVQHAYTLRDGLIERMDVRES